MASATAKAETEVGAEKVITILLLGETGVGKSTFINAFFNYLVYDELNDAKTDVKCLIPSKFTVCDKKYNPQTVTFGKPDPNEDQEPGQSSTKHCRCYVFKVDNVKVQIIDGPGIGDTRGVQTDGTNMRNLLDFIAKYKEINAICILLKPNNSRVDVVFKYCILQLLTHLDKSAARNIMFVFTNARGTFYRPGDTADSLKVVLETIKKKPPYVEIVFGNKNVFCLDNEAFRYLVATSPPNKIRFTPTEMEDFKSSWRTSVRECRRLLTSLIRIPPHQVQDTISVNKARTSIVFLTEPLGQIAKYITDNMKACEDHKKKVFEWEGDIEQLRDQLYTPSVDIISAPLDYPRTVCGDPNCCEKIDVDGCIKIHYKTVCHDPCNLDSSDGNVIGNKGLLDCDAFNDYEFLESFRMISVKDSKWHPDVDLTANKDGKIWAANARRIKLDRCNKCKHSYEVHLHIFTETYIKHTKVRDDLKYGRIVDREEAVKAQAEKIEELEDRIKRLEKDRDRVTKYTAKFASFLSHNAITPFNDAFEDYLHHLIENAKAGLDSGDRQLVSNLEKMLENHKIEKQLLGNFIKTKMSMAVSAKDVQDAIDALCKLKMCGAKFKEYLETQKQSQQVAHVQHKEVVCDVQNPKSSWLKRIFSFNK